MKWIPFCVVVVVVMSNIKKIVSFVLPRARLFSSMEGMDPIKIIIVYWCIEKISQKLIKNKSFGICFFFVFDFIFFSLLNSLRNEFILFLCYGFCYLAQFIAAETVCGSWFLRFILNVVFILLNFFSDEEKTNI